MSGFVTVKVKRFDQIAGTYMKEWIPITENKPNVLTNNGRDAFHDLVYINTVAGTRGYGVIALSMNTGSTAAGDTLLTTEISVNGLQRADAGTKTQTNGTNQSTIEHTFTSNANFTDVRLSGLFNTTTTDTTTLSHEAAFASVSLATSDLLRVTFVLNLG